MALPVGAASKRAEEEQRLMAELPGWECWAIGTHDRRILWSAQSAGALGAVITDAKNPEELAKAVRDYEAALPEHLASTRFSIAGQPDTGIGRDRVRVLCALAAALEAMAAAREGEL